MKTNYIRQLLLPLIAAGIWGMSFVYQSDSVAYVEPFTFTAIRSAVGSLFLVLVLLVRRVFSGRKGNATQSRPMTNWRALLFGGFVCGTVLTAATNLQQFGIGAGTSAGKAAFITALYVVLVPVAGLLLFRKNQSPAIWVSVVIAVVGLYFLCVGGTEGLAKGDVFVILCAIAFTAHILVIDHFSPHTDGIALSCVQFAVVALWSTLGMLAFESPSWEAIVRCAVPILYVGVLSSGIAYTLQIIAQKGTNSTVVALLLCLESVFATVAAVLMRGQWLSDRETLGSALMLVAVVLAQLPSSLWRRVFGVRRDEQSK